MGKNPPNTEFKTVQELCGTLARGEKALKAVVYDEPLPSYYLANHPSANLTLVGDLFNESNYAFVLQKGSPLHKDINLALLRLFERGVQDQLRHKHLVAPASQ